jgi:hypothetical protein
MLYNIYGDESCHLENDGKKAMVIGAVWCPNNQVKSISDDIRQIKKDYGLKPYRELKWTKISPHRIDLYLEIIRYFFENPNLRYRGLVIPDKSILNHKYFNQDHDIWYYKMYFTAIKTILDNSNEYEIYLDIKDTNSSERIKGLHNALCNAQYDLDRNIIKRVQTIRSHESQIMQLTDIFNGALSYHNRGLSSSRAKESLINLIKEKTKLSLSKSTLYSEKKFNIFVIQLQEIF